MGTFGQQSDSKRKGSAFASRVELTGYRPFCFCTDGELCYEDPLLVHSVSVVVTAEFHNPSILNSDFLESKEIVPLTGQS